MNPRNRYTVRCHGFDATLIPNYCGTQWAVGSMASPPLGIAKELLKYRQFIEAVDAALIYINRRHEGQTLTPFEQSHFYMLTGQS